MVTMRMIRKAFRIFSFALLLLVIFIGVGWLFENWRGSREWEKSKKRADEMGVSLDPADYALPGISEDDDLMKDPVFLAEWNREIDPPLRRIGSMKLPGLKQRGIKNLSSSRGSAFEFTQYFDENLSEEEAVMRVSEIYAPVAARLDLLANAILSKPPQNLDRNHWDFLREDAEVTRSIINQRSIANAFREQALLAIRQNRMSKALRCCLANARLSKKFSNLNLIDKLMADALLGTIEGVVWEGIRLHRWSDRDLKTLATLFPIEMDFEELEKIYHYETAFGVGMVDYSEEILQKYLSLWQDSSAEKPDKPNVKERVRHWLNYRGPAGWQDWRRSVVLEQGLDLIDAREEWTHPWKERFNNVVTIDIDTYEPSFHPLAPFQSSISGGPIRVITRHITQNRLARIGIALEQYYLKQNAYPETLDLLSLNFPIIDLTDPQKRPLQYRPTDDGYFTIWSEYEKEMSSSPRALRIRWLFSEKESFVR